MANWHKMINICLAAVCVLLLIWFAKIWLGRGVVPAPPSAGGKKAFQRDTDDIVPPQASFDVISRKNIFSITRGSMGKVPEAYAARPHLPQKPMPKLTLVGTMMMGDASKAMINVDAPEKGTSMYGIGDGIGGFVVKEIRADEVLLEGDGNIIITVSAKGAHPQAQSQMPAANLPPDPQIPAGRPVIPVNQRTSDGMTQP
ncbi:MAG: hypothetical protein HZB85_00860 [Deltaproteobacteria bacterium]|nr:hypothetical protein [Deltaproteobacteria bacterium]